MNYFYFGTMRKLTGSFGSLFSNISIQHKDNSGVVQKNFRVPLRYGSKNAWFERMKQRERDDKQQARTAITLPRISFEMNGLSYANDRKLNKVERKVRVQKSTTGTLRDKILAQLNDAPYDFAFNVTIYAKNEDDGLQIMEQILPYFTPSKTLTIKEIPEINLERDVHIDLIGVSSEDTYEGSINSLDRVITWNLSFIARGYIFPPIQDAKLIKEVKATIAKTGSTEIISQIDTVVNPKTANKDEKWVADVKQKFPLK